MNNKDVFRINSKVNIIPSQITHLVSNLNYTFIYTSGSQHLHTKTLKIVSERLKNINFLKVRRGLMVNTDYINHINYNKLNPYIELSNGAKFLISRRVYENIKKAK
jgi:DNA-binding LytR/AlgR family response regulator